MKTADEIFDTTLTAFVYLLVRDCGLTKDQLTTLREKHLDKVSSNRDGVQFSIKSLEAFGRDFIKEIKPKTIS